MMKSGSNAAVEGLQPIWASLGGKSDDLNRVRVIHAGNHLPSVYDVSSFATALVAAANLAVAELYSFRSGNSLPEVEVDALEASATFKSEALLKPFGWALPPSWDPIAGDYRAQDTWIRLHTNYLHHKQAVLKVLGLPEGDRESVSRALSGWKARELETAVVAAGGCAAMMYSESEWETDSLGRTTTSELIVTFDARHRVQAAPPDFSGGELPLSGLKVLDLTRVIAGPECTRFLAAWGAQVLRIDPPGFEEVPAVIPDVTVGKRCAFLDLGDALGLEKFEALVRQAHVLVLGYRPEALDRFGLSPERLRELNPALIVGRLNAYGWKSALRERRGFDSLVQMSVGIAARGAEHLGQEKPFPLPAQALDHGAGYALAAGICRALHSLWTRGENSIVSASLVGVANLLKSGPFRNGSLHPGDLNSDFTRTLVEDESEWGRLARVVHPGRFGGLRGKWTVQAGSLGRHPAEFEKGIRK